MNHRILILVAALMLATATMAAQVPSALSALFGGKYRDNPAATETVISGDPLKPYSLSSFHSLEVRGDRALADPLEKAVMADGARAKWKETVVKGGCLASGVYELEGAKRRRYILYLNTFPTGGNTATVIYLEGKATPEQIKKLIRTISK